MKLAKTLFTFCLLSLTALQNLPGQPVDRIFSPNELQADFKVLRGRYENNLANLYLYSSKQHLDKFFDSLYLNIKPMTELEFYSYITPLSSIIKDGHSNIFPSQRSTLQFNQKSNFFPFNVYWTENKLFITQNLSPDTTIQIGTEILSINGVSSKDVMTFLLTRQVRDGNNENYALWILNNYFREYYSYHFGHPDKYSLTLKTVKSPEMKIVVEALSKQVISSNNDTGYSQATVDAATFFHFDSTSNAAIFTIKTWDNKYLNKQIDFVISKMHLNNIDNLILDLRDNQGGNASPAIYLLSYLLNQDFQYFNELKSVDVKTHTSQILKSRRGKMLGTHQVRKNAYNGKLYVLINGGAFSNTGAFCSRLEFYKRAVFIGEETGGNKVVFSGVFGLKQKVRLPYTKIICDNSNYRMTVTDFKENTGHGVLPTYVVTPTIDDLVQNKDVVLNATLDLIRSKQ